MPRLHITAELGILKIGVIATLENENDAACQKLGRSELVKALARKVWIVPQEIHPDPRT